MDPLQVRIFVKPPLPGQVKTRLAEAIGANQAAELAAAFLHDTLNDTRALDWAQVAIATIGDIAPFLPVSSRTSAGLPLPIWQQGPGDLGQRIECIMRQALSQSGAAIALGADTPGLPARLMEQARAALVAGQDAVLGPTEDGGFYLLGLRYCPDGLLADLPWSASSTLEQTCERLRASGMTVAELDPWFDVDRMPELRRLARLIEKSIVDAPATGAVLARLRRRPLG